MIKREAQGTVRHSKPNADGSVRWDLLFRVVGQKDEIIKCKHFHRVDDAVAVEAWADLIRAGRRNMTKVHPNETIAQWFGRHFDDQVRAGMQSVSDARSIFRNHIEKDFGARAAKDGSITTAEIEDWITRLDHAVRAGKMHWKTAINIDSVLRAGLNEATTSKDRSLRVLTVNPMANVKGPDRGRAKQKTFLLPAEVFALLSCERIPERRRHLYAVALMTGMRLGELRSLRACDVDLVAMRITVARQSKGRVDKERTKTGVARPVAIEPNLVPLLEYLTHDVRPEQRILRMASGTSVHATTLRADLVTAGCKRADLHVAKNDPMRKRMTFHMLRDTLGCHMSVRGDSPQHIQWRLGHATLAMSQKYIDRARYEAGPAFGTPLAPFPANLFTPDPNVTATVIVSSPDPKNPAKTAYSGVLSGRLSSDETPINKPPNEVSAVSDCDESQAPEVPDSASQRNDLESALAAAASAGRWDVVTMLAAELLPGRRVVK